MRQIAASAASLLTSDVANRATTFFLYALVARYLSPFAFGQMSLALTLFYTFQVLAVAGLKTLITRAVAKDTSQTEHYFVAGSVVVLVASLLSLLALFIFVQLMAYNAETTSVVLLLALGLLPYSLSAICEAIFLGWERARYIAYANVPANVAKVLFALLILSQGGGLYQLIWLLLATFLGVLVTELWLMRRLVRAPLRLDLSFARTLVRTTGTFLGIDGVLAILPSLNIILLAKMAGEADVGLYSAANQLLVPITLVYQSVALGVFPVMCRSFEPGQTRLKQITEAMVELLLVVTLPTLIALSFLADSALVLLYGSHDFALAATALQITVWNLISIALTSVLGQVLLAGMREKVTLRIVAVDAVIGLVCGLVLISRLGLVGAAITTLLIRTVDLAQHYVPVSRMLGGLRLGRASWRPATAGLCMAAYLYWAQGQPLWVVAPIASVVYLAVLLPLAVWTLGGPQRVRSLVHSIYR